MTTQQPEALRLADLLAYESSPDSVYWKCAAELRRLHAECEALRKRLARQGGQQHARGHARPLLQCVQVAIPVVKEQGK